MLLRKIALGLLGTGFGLMTSGGVFTVLLAVGLIPRFAGKTHTGKYVVLYENMVILGAVIGGIFSVFPNFSCPLGRIGGSLAVCLYGFFAGIFIGSLAMAIAEMLDSIPIFARRIGFRHGLGVAVTAMALGKMAGSLYYFWNHMYLFS